MNTNFHRWLCALALCLTVTAVQADHHAETTPPAPKTEASSAATAQVGTLNGDCENCQSYQHGMTHCDSCNYHRRLHGGGLLGRVRGPARRCGDPNCYQCRNGLAGCQHCKVSPGTGYCPPGKLPINHQYVEYWKYWPNYWSGQGYGTPLQYYPHPYTPTDTTQLGYTYQHVPQWRPMMGMTPPNPYPSDWHRRYCGPFHHHDFMNHDGRFGHLGGRFGHRHNGYCPTCQPTPASADGEMKPVPDEMSLQKSDAEPKLLPVSDN